MFQALMADLRYALRVLARNPGFTLLGVTSLAIGIGFNTTMFSVVDAVLFRPLPVERPEQIVDIYTLGRDAGDSYSTSSYPDYLDFRDRNEVFTDLVAYSPAIAAVKTGERSELTMGEVVSGNYFQVLGVRPAIGRTLLPEDDRPGAPRAVVLSHRLWRSRYASDAGVLGRTLHIYGQPYTIVGVAPASFTGMVPLLQPQLWLPIAWVEEVEPAGIQSAVPSPTGNTRLEPTALLDRMRREVLALEPAAVFLDSHTMEAQVDASLLPARLAAQALGLVGAVATALGAIGLYGVIAYVVARRTREIGLRMALGASPGRVVRLIMRQGLTIAVVGLAAGAVLAWFAARAVSAALYGVGAGDPLAWAGAVTVLLGAAALANYVPARRAARVDPSVALRQAGE